MNIKIVNYVDTIFAPYKESPKLKEFKEEILSYYEEKYFDLKEQGLEDDEAFLKTIESIETVLEPLPSTKLLKLWKLLKVFRRIPLPPSLKRVLGGN